MSIDTLIVQLDILMPALVAGIIVLSTHVPMGQEVLRRGIIFLDLAIAQTAAFGLVLAGRLGLDMEADGASAWLIQGIAIFAALIAGVVLYQFRSASARVQEALIGILFILMATGSILLLANDPHGGDRLNDILVGQILWVEYQTLAVVAAIYACVLLLWFRLKERFGALIFYPLFAVTITLSTQLIGVYLVFASLIVPALVCLDRQRALVKAYGIGMIGYVIGLSLSAALDLPSGAMVAWVLVATGLVCFLFMKRRDKKKLEAEITMDGA